MQIVLANLLVGRCSARSEMSEGPHNSGNSPGAASFTRVTFPRQCSSAHAATDLARMSAGALHHHAPKSIKIITPLSQGTPYSCRYDKLLNYSWLNLPAHALSKLRSLLISQSLHYLQPGQLNHVPTTILNRHQLQPSAAS
jgi:hypothetical protein